MINFKDRIKKNIQQEQQQQQQTGTWTKQNKTISKDSSRKDLYRQVTNQLSSQQFQPGDFRRNDNALIQVTKRRNSSILQMDHQDDQRQQCHVQNYGNGSNTQRSLLNSNVADNYNGSLFQSKLHETKGQLSQQISDLQKRIKKQIQRDRGAIQDYLNRLFNKFNEKSKQQQRKNFDTIISQLNKNLNVTSKKQKMLQTGMAQNSQKLQSFQKLFNEFTTQTQQKLQRIINKNAGVDIASSMKKSLSRNMGNGQYVMELKNSIKDIPVQNNAIVDEITSQIHQLQDTIKNLKFEFIHFKQEIKTKTLAPAEVHKQKTDYVQSSKIIMIQQQINQLKLQIQQLSGKQEDKYLQLRGVLQIQQQNYKGMNDTFAQAINTGILPRLKKIQDQINCQSIQRNIQYIKKQVIRQLQSCPIIRVKHLSEQQKQKLQKIKLAHKSQQTVYMLDDMNYILDCFGNYLLDDNNQRVKLQEDQIYYLEQVEGIQIKMSTLEAK